MINRPIFYNKIREYKLFTVLTQLQVASIDAILNECEAQLTDPRQMAYVLATAYHECHNPKRPDLRMTPMKEFGGHDYLVKKDYYPYFGRGFSQLTWDYNYKKEGTRLKLDLLNNPDQMLNIPVAANSHVYCMKNGVYTRKKLSNYINDKGCDFLNARRVVNGTDRAQLISGYAETFLKCL
ncbi:MAG TPA: glycoside hydrolase family 19 protein [Ferruginibacter sp.]|nr:glycoside hydrolase family 19 protein [Ferruginibacter sp.]